MMDWLTALDLEGHWWWLVFAAILGIAEIILPGVFLIWIAIAAAVTGVITLASGIALPLQIGLFALLSLAVTYAGRRWYRDNPVPSADPLLNDRASRLIGSSVVVAKVIEGGHGRVTVGDSEWLAQGPDAPVGSRVRITGVDGATLLVAPV